MFFIFFIIVFMVTYALVQNFIPEFAGFLGCLGSLLVSLIIVFILYGMFSLI